MKAIVALFTLTAASATTHPRALFQQWTRDYNRTYATSAEYETRLRNFRANIEQIELMNRRHADKPDGARFRLNKYADLSKEEQRKLRGTRVTKNVADSMPKAPKQPNAPLSLAVDWRMSNVLAPIQDQGMCGSCWAFSTTSNIESQLALKNNRTGVTKLSEQQLVDCDHTCGTYRGEQGCDAGCDGGLQPNAFTWVQHNGQTTEQAYPYAGVDQTCPTSSLPAAARVKGFVMVSQNENEMAQWVQANGPMSVAVDASEWTFYWGGIMYYLCYGTETYDDLDHAVNVVGFGTSGSEAYWIIRNSWGTDWGESGYAKIVRNMNFCGINLFACSATV